MTELQRFSEPVTCQALPRLLTEPTRGHIESFSVSRDLTAARQVVARMSTLERIPSGSSRAKWDWELMVPLHQALRGLRRSILVDMQFWSWLAVTQFPEFVWLRWYGRIPQDPASALTPALEERFLGTRTLHGVSRNAIARLFWSAETLYSEKDEYSLVQQSLSSQDFFQSIFEREFSLYPPAARACVRALATASEQERRDAIHRLNHYLTTIVLETLQEADVRELLLR